MLNNHHDKVKIKGCSPFPVCHSSQSRDFCISKPEKMFPAKSFGVLCCFFVLSDSTPVKVEPGSRKNVANTCSTTLKSNPYGDASFDGVS